MFDEWVVLSPIENLDIESGSLTIANVKFYWLTDVRMAQWVCFKKLEEAGLKKFSDKFFKDLIFPSASFHFNNSAISNSYFTSFVPRNA